MITTKTLNSKILKLIEKPKFFKYIFDNPSTRSLWLHPKIFKHNQTPLFVFKPYQNR